jgi:hypothetical protein
MRKKLIQSSLLAGNCLVFGSAIAAHAGVVVDGSINGSEGYGAPLATQTINTGFGDSTVGDGTSTGGSELDAAYGVVSGGNLNLFFSGNFESNGNLVNVFIDDGRAGGQNVLHAAGGSGSLPNMNGSIFSPGFNATYATESNNYSGTVYSDQYDLINNTAAYVGAVPLTGGIGNGVLTNGVTLGMNDTNALGVNGNAGTTADPVAADAVTTGLELSIPLSALGNPAPGSSILVLADINGNGDGYLSNQFLPGLPVGTQNLGSGTPFTGSNSGSFNLSNTPGEYITVTVPEPTSIAALGGGLLMLCSRRRRTT